MGNEVLVMNMMSLEDSCTPLGEYLRVSMAANHPARERHEWMMDKIAIPPELAIPLGWDERDAKI